MPWSVLFRRAGAGARPYVLLFISSFAFAADLQISASLDKTRVALNEQVVLSLNLAGSGTNLPSPNLPDLPNFQVYNAGRAQNYSWVNGQATASVTYSFVLTPLREGQFTIPSIAVQMNGQSAQTTPLSLEVVKGEPNAVQGSAVQEHAAPQAPSRGSAAIFITGTVDKTTVHVGEPIQYTFRLYNRVNLLRQPNYQPPETQGFWTEDLPPQRNYQSVVKGVPYQVTELRTALFPTSPGKAHIGAATLRVMLENVGTDPFSQDFFASFFGRAEEKLLRTEPVTVTVKPLPEPKPAGFKGAVGRFTLSAAMDKDTTTVGQPVTLTVTVSGQGNIKSLPDVGLPTLTNFRTLSDNAATQIEKKDGQVQGSKVFKTVLIPTASGDLTVPSLSYVYFDTDSRTYRTLNSRSFHIRVNPGSGGAATPGYVPSATETGPVTSGSIQRLADDVRYIRVPGGDLVGQGLPLYKRTWFLGIHLLTLAGFAGYGLFRLTVRLFFSNAALARFRNARARALRQATEADKAMGSANPKTAASLLAGALQTYLADKLSLDHRELALRRAMDALLAQGVSEHSGQKVRAIWETFDLFRFAPAQVRPEEFTQAREKFVQIVDSLEKEIVWKG